MATQQEILEIIARVKGEEEVKRLTKDVRDLENQIEALKSTIAQTSGPAQARHAGIAAGLNDQLKDVKKNLAAAQAELKTAGGAFAAFGKTGGQGLLQASYAIDDLQYGLRGVVNNIAPMVAAFGGPAGIAGAAGIAAVAIKLLSDHWDKLESIWGGSQAKTEAEMIKELGANLHKTAAEVEYFYKTKKKLEAEDAAQTAFKAQANKGTEGQALGAEGLSSRVSQRGDVRTGKTGAERLAEMLGGRGIMPTVAPVDPATLLKMETLKSNPVGPNGIRQGEAGIKEIREEIEKLKKAESVIGQVGLGKPRKYEKGEAGFEEAKAGEIGVQEKKLQVALGAQKDLYEQEVRPALEKMIGKLFNNPGTEDYSKVQKFLSNYLDALIQKGAAGTVSPEVVAAESKFIKGVLEDMSKTNPADMAKVAEKDVSRKISEIDEKVNDKVEELVNLTDDALTERISKAVAALKQVIRKAPANQAGLKEVERAAKEAEDAIGDRSKDLKAVQDAKTLEKQFSDRIAAFNKAVTGLEDAGEGAMSETLAEEVGKAREHFQDKPHTKFSFKDIDDELDKVEQAIGIRKEAFLDELKRSNERIRKTKEKIADVPGFDRDLEDDARERLKMGEQRRSKARAVAVRATAKGIFNLPGAPATMAESKKLAEEKTADAEKKAQQEQWFGAGKRVKEKMPGMDERIQRFEGTSLLQGYSQEQIRKQLLPQIAGQVKKEGGKGMTDKEATRQAGQILDDAMKQFGQKLTNESQQQEQQPQHQNPAILGIKEYAQKLQTETGQDNVQKKQLTTQEAILQAILKQRPDVLQQVAGARFT